VPDTTVVCIDSLWEYTTALYNSTIVDPYEHPFPKKKGTQKIQNCDRMSRKISVPDTVLVVVFSLYFLLFLTVFPARLAANCCCGMTGV